MLENGIKLPMKYNPENGMQKFYIFGWVVGQQFYKKAFQIRQEKWRSVMDVN